MSVRYKGNLLKQLWAHTEKRKGPLRTKCWIWTGYLNKDGYAWACIKSLGRAVHRFAFQFFHGPIPFGYELDHLCRNRACWRPLHLEVVTHQINVARGCAGQHLAQRKRCKNGHPFNKKNTYWYSWQGHLHRACKICKAERNAN